MTEGYPPQWQNDVQAEVPGQFGEVPTQYGQVPVQVGQVPTQFGGGQHESTTAWSNSAPATDAAYAPSDLNTDDSSDQSKADAAKEQASAVGQGAAEAGAQVASVAKDQAQNVVAEAGSQAKDLLGQARSELTEQAGAQQKRLTETLHSLAQELESMGQHSQEPGIATDLVKQASGRAHAAASWLESREPGSLLSELQSFARQRPAAFLALAAGAGLAAGRLGRGVKDATSDDSSSTPATAAPAAQAYSTEDARPFATSQDGGYQAYSPNEGGL